MTVNRRTFLGQSATRAGAAAIAACFGNLLDRASSGRDVWAAESGALQPVKDATRGLELLPLPDGGVVARGSFQFSDFGSEQHPPSRGLPWLDVTVLGCCVSLAAYNSVGVQPLG